MCALSGHRSAHISKAHIQLAKSKSLASLGHLHKSKCRGGLFGTMLDDHSLALSHTATRTSAQSPLAPPKPNPTPHSPQPISPLAGLLVVGLARCGILG